MDVKSTVYAEGKTFEILGEEAIQSKLLETFPYQGPRQRICYKMTEFAAVCPFSGLPDYGIVWIKYTPIQMLVELKSLKYYFQTFRHVGIFQEAATARIFNDLWACLKPEKLVVKSRYNTRGGIDTTCNVRSSDQKY